MPTLINGKKRSRFLNAYKLSALAMRMFLLNSETPKIIWPPKSAAGE
jgi:hypothetical protein